MHSAVGVGALLGEVHDRFDRVSALLRRLMRE
jgi:hypothetical protein